MNKLEKLLSGKAKTSFLDGITPITAGGSHESNKNGGVPVGTAPDGQPNLVEEGEVMLDKNNILSKSLKITSKMDDPVLKKYVGKSFAEAFAEEYGLLGDRHDAYTMNEVRKLKSKFFGAQEELKLEQQKEKVDAQASMSEEEIKAQATKDADANAEKAEADNAKVMQEALAQQGGIFRLGGELFCHGGKKFCGGGHKYGGGGEKWEDLDKMESLYDIVERKKKRGEAIPFEISSGYRKPGQAGKAGANSWHTHKDQYGNPMAYDIVPTAGKSFDDVKRYIAGDPEMSLFLSKDYKMANGDVRQRGIIDETTAADIKKYGATGATLHLGIDTAAKKGKDLNELLANAGKPYSAPKRPNFEKVSNTPTAAGSVFSKKEMPEAKLREYKDSGHTFEGNDNTKPMSKEQEPVFDTTADKRASAMRYAPALGSLMDVANQGKYMATPDAQKANKRLQSVLEGMDFTTGPKGREVTATPQNAENAVNTIAAQNAGTKALIADKAAGNRATMLAGLLAADRNAVANQGAVEQQIRQSNQQAQNEAIRTNNATESEYQQRLDRAKQLKNTMTADITNRQIENELAAKNADRLTKKALWDALFNNMGELGKDAANRYDSKTIVNNLGIDGFQTDTRKKG